MHLGSAAQHTKQKGGYPAPPKSIFYTAPLCFHYITQRAFVLHHRHVSHHGVCAPAGAPQCYTHLTAHAPRSSLHALDYTHSAYHCECTDSHLNVWVCSFLCFSEKHLFSPFFALFLLLPTLRFLFTRLDKEIALL